MQVKLEPTEDDDYNLAYSSTGNATDDRKPGAGLTDDDDDDSDEEDDEFEEVGLELSAEAAGPSNTPLASRQADDEEHPALVLRRRQEAKAAAAAAAAGGDGEGAAARPVFRDGKGGNRPAIEVQIAVPEERDPKGKGKKRCVWVARGRSCSAWATPARSRAACARASFAS